MSAPLRHICGQHVGQELQTHGFQHILYFFDLCTSGELTRCPGCGDDLGDAMIEGALVEVESHS